MPKTIPSEDSFIHKIWHRFSKGMCAFCGCYCVDCPDSIITCKCSDTIRKKTEEDADLLLKQENAGITDYWLE